MKKSLKKGGVGDVVTIIIIIGLALALVVGAIIPTIQKGQTTSSNARTDMGEVDTFISNSQSGVTI